MKIGLVFRIVLISLFVAGCNETASEKVTYIKDKATVDASSIVPFAGTWVKRAYVDTLLLTHSPMASQSVEWFYYIPLSDTEIGYSFTIHEGADQYRVLKRDGRYLLQFIQGKTSGIEVLSQNVIKIGGEEYLKVADSVCDRVSERFLFPGQFAKGDTVVEFTSDGKIIGLDTFSFYHVQNDYYGAGLDRDLMYMGATVGDVSNVTFSFRNDTLIICTIKCALKDENDDCVEIENDKVCYRLVKQR
ncbi:MAG: hypothetical protein KF744_07230 [Taibaiella sp.]|nr:hypothetical protein [Taibaiella sp.]